MTDGKRKYCLTLSTGQTIDIGDLASGKYENVTIYNDGRFARFLIYWGERSVEEAYLVQCAEGGGRHENNYKKYRCYAPEDYFAYNSICVGKDLMFLKFNCDVEAFYCGVVHNNKGLKFFKTQKEAFDFKSALIKQIFEKETLELQQEIEQATRLSEYTAEDYARDSADFFGTVFFKMRKEIAAGVNPENIKLLKQLKQKEQNNERLSR